MEHVVDTLIVGAGPAGLFCGIELCRRKVSNLILEKRAFPRDKTCGGGVTEKTYRLLCEGLERSEAELSDLFCDQNGILELYYENERLTRSDLESPFRFVKRNVFDHFLATEYRRRGGNLLENTTCKSIDPDRRLATLSNGDTVAYQHLVVADGALSPTAKALGYQRPKQAFCVETQIPKEKIPGRDAVGIYFGLVKHGYVWFFPSGEEFCIGLGGLYDKSVHYDEILKEFLGTLGVDPDLYPIKGAFLPYGNMVNQSRGREDILLIGDAGGFVDPIYGEGLYFALASGIEAGSAIFEDPRAARSAFLSRMKPYRKIIQEGTRLQRIFFRPASQKHFRKIAAGRNGFVGFFADHLLASYEYSYSFSGLEKLVKAYKQKKQKQ